MDRSSFTDEELIERFRSDDADRHHWVNELFRRYQRPVAAWCFRMTGERESALDLAQEVFMKAHRSLSSFEGRSRFSSWLYSITRNHCLNAIQRYSRAPVEVDTDEARNLAEPTTENLADRLHAQIDGRETLRFLNGVLTDLEARVMMMHFGEGFHLSTITRFLKLENRSGAKAYVVSAKRKIDRALKRRSAASDEHATR